MTGSASKVSVAERSGGRSRPEAKGGGVRGGGSKNSSGFLVGGFPKGFQNVSLFCVVFCIDFGLDFGSHFGAFVVNFAVDFYISFQAFIFYVLL